MVAQQKEGMERGLPVGQHSLVVSRLVSQRHPAPPLPIEQFVILSFPDEVVIVAREEAYAGNLSRALQFPAVPHVVHVVGVVERERIAVEEVFQPAPRADMEIAQEPPGAERVPVCPEGVKLGHVSARPVGRKVSEVAVFPFIGRCHHVVTVVFQFRDDVDGQRVGKVLAVGHLELPARHGLQELVGTVVAEFAFEPTVRLLDSSGSKLCVRPCLSSRKASPALSMPDLL